MDRATKLLFESILNGAEIKKVDFKGSQYRLDNDVLKSQFVKDILCMANASGGDGYIVLGVDAEGNQRKIVGIHTHHDSAMLEEIVSSVIEEPIHFEYYPIRYRGKECALLHIPASSARPHWPKKDFGKLHKRVFYIRRSSGNREASPSEIREMFVSSIRVSDIPRRQPKSAAHIIDELAALDVDQRSIVMYDMLRDVAANVKLKQYALISHEKYGWSISRTFALVRDGGLGSINEYAIFMYPTSVTKNNILWSRDSLNRITDSYEKYSGLKDLPKKGGMVKASKDMWHSYDQTQYKLGKQLKKVGARLLNCTIVHISYTGMYTRFDGLQWGGLSLQNSWKETWGQVVKWRLLYPERASYEFFVPNVVSRIELSARLSALFSWINAHPI